MWKHSPSFLFAFMPKCDSPFDDFFGVGRNQRAKRITAPIPSRTPIFCRAVYFSL